MNAIVNNLKVFQRYFAAEIIIDDVHSHLKVYNDNYIDFEKDFYAVLINSNEDIRNEIIELLLVLNVNHNLWGRYFNQNLTISQFFKELAKDHEDSIQLNQLIDLIVKRRWHSQLILLRNLTIGAAIVVPLLTLASYPVLTLVVQFLLETANILPILGIVFSFINLAFNIYLNHLCDRKQKSKIYRDDVFLVASSIVNIIGKIALVAKTMFAPFAAFFFIAATLIDTLKELFFLLELRKNYINKPSFDENDKAIIHQQYARHEYDYIKQRNALIINFISALSLTALVITCSFFPVGLVLTLSTCASIASVYLLKLLFLTINERIIASRLQTELKNISDEHKSEPVNETSLEPFVNELIQSLRIDDLRSDDEAQRAQIVTTTKQKDLTASQIMTSSASRYRMFAKTGSLIQRQQPHKEQRLDQSTKLIESYGSYNYSK